MSETDETPVEQYVPEDEDGADEPVLDGVEDDTSTPAEDEAEETEDSDEGVVEDSEVQSPVDAQDTASEPSNG